MASPRPLRRRAVAAALWAAAALLLLGAAERPGRGTAAVAATEWLPPAPRRGAPRWWNAAWDDRHGRLGLQEVSLPPDGEGVSKQQLLTGVLLGAGLVAAAAAWHALDAGASEVLVVASRTKPPLRPVGFSLTSPHRRVEVPLALPPRPAERGTHRTTPTPAARVARAAPGRRAPALRAAPAIIGPGWEERTPLLDEAAVRPSSSAGHAVHFAEVPSAKGWATGPRDSPSGWPSGASMCCLAGLGDRTLFASSAPGAEDGPAARRCAADGEGGGAGSRSVPDRGGRRPQPQRRKSAAWSPCRDPIVSPTVPYTDSSPTARLARDLCRHPMEQPPRIARWAAYCRQGKYREALLSRQHAAGFHFTTGDDRSWLADRLQVTGAMLLARLPGPACGHLRRTYWLYRGLPGGSWEDFVALAAAECSAGWVHCPLSPPERAQLWRRLRTVLGEVCLAPADAPRRAALLLRHHPGSSLAIPSCPLPWSR